MVRPTVVLAVLLGLAGCTNKLLSAFEANVQGTWEGTTSITQAGHTTSGPGRYVILPRSDSTVLVANFCTDGTGPLGTSTSATTFTLGTVSCPPEAQGGCAAVVSRLDGGTASVDGGTLTMAFDGAAAGCSQASPFTGGFTGTRQQ